MLTGNFILRSYIYKERHFAAPYQHIGDTTFAKSDLSIHLNQTNITQSDFELVYINILINISKGQKVCKSFT